MLGMARRRRPICGAGAAFASQDATAFPSVLSVSVVTFLILRLNKPRAHLSNLVGKQPNIPPHILPCPKPLVKRST